MDDRRLCWPSQYKGIPIIKIRQSHSHLIFVMGILMPGTMVYILKLGHRGLFSRRSCWPIISHLYISSCNYIQLQSVRIEKEIIQPGHAHIEKLPPDSVYISWDIFITVKPVYKDFRSPSFKQEILVNAWIISYKHALCFSIFLSDFQLYHLFVGILWYIWMLKILANVLHIITHVWHVL